MKPVLPRSERHVISIGETTDAEWDAYVHAHPERSAYHYSGWPRLISRAFGHQPIMLAATAGEKEGKTVTLEIRDTPYKG